MNDNAPSPAKAILVKNELIGYRLDKFLIKIKNSHGKIFSGFSRARIQNLIKQKMIKVNGLSSSPHYKLKKNDIVNIAYISLAAAEIKTGATKNLADIPVKIILETEEYLVIDKPAGLSVHGQNDQAITLVDVLIKKYPQLINVGEDSSRPGIVHRLDKDVSGLMIIAKTQASFTNLKRQFRYRTITKEYTALVYGKIDHQPSAVINFPIRRAKKGYKMAALPLTDFGQINQTGKQAETQFDVLKNFINYALLKIKINTGRTHQIRVHLYAYGHPLVGDNIYGTAKTRLLNKKLNLKRVFLVADKLGFTDLAGHKQTYAINLPDDFKKILKQIK